MTGVTAEVSACSTKKYSISRILTFHQSDVSSRTLQSSGNGFPIPLYAGTGLAPVSLGSRPRPLVLRGLTVSLDESRNPAKGPNTWRPSFYWR